MDAAELETRFTYHPPTADQPEKYTTLRDHAHTIAKLIVVLTPESREQSLALTKLEESVFWANAAIARRSPAPRIAGESSIPQDVTS
jgi:hypothetical protein